MLSIGVMASLAQERYSRQALACLETWVKEAEELNVPVTFFCGNHEERYFFSGNNVEFVHFPIQDDYLSATFKTWYGFRHLLKQKAHYYLLVGTDNYVEVKKTLETLQRYSSTVPSLIGGYAQTRSMEREVVFPSGGGGLILTRAALEDLNPRIEYYLQRWKERCLEFQRKDLLVACDVSIADAAWDRGYSLIIEKGFYPCSWRGVIKGEERRGGFLPVNLDILCIHHYLEEGEMYFYHKFKQYGEEFLALEKKHKTSLYFPYCKVYIKVNEELFLYLLIRENITEFKERTLYLDEVDSSLLSLGKKFQVEVKEYRGEEVDYSH